MGSNQKARPPLHERVEARTPVLARRMIEAFIGQIPSYAMLPAEQLGGEVLAICERNLRLFFACIAERRTPTDAELADLRASAARRAEEQVPLEAVLSAYHLGGRIGWQALVEEAHEDEHDVLAAHGTGLLHYLEAVTGSVATAYLEEQQLIYGEERDARRTFADALLAAAEDASAGPTRDRLLALADRAGVSLADSYVVMALRLGRSSDEQASGVSPAVAGRRKVRRVVEQTEHLVEASVLSLLDPGGGLLLVPTTAEGPPDLLERADHLVDELGKAADAEVLAGLAWRPGWSGVARAAPEAREVLRIAVRLGATSGAFTSQEVLLEQALTASSPWTSRLAGLLEPLEDKPDQLATLEAWFGADFDRQETARVLQVHPNTVDYRLQRVAATTGLDLGSARGLQLLGAALLARRVAGL